MKRLLRLGLAWSGATALTGFINAAPFRNLEFESANTNAVFRFDREW
jgi:hypothetical protein